MHPSTSLGGSEPLARFLTQHNQYKTSIHAVRPNAFIPPESDLCLSVSLVTGMNCQQILSYGQISVINVMLYPPILYGFASIRVIDVEETSLTVVFDNKPRGHVSITGWPDDKSIRKLLSIKLASKAKLVLKEDCI